ncbi:ABC transporter ATP-binding protein [Isoptericola sp. AK164]|uniref:ABC transporter ATP-binding protein n=1 Tax=Isoptericola sp. AK164 TaxID=3024246 RepID=UPI0024183D52|nr:ABC transporter ATP-binding protein [Isoptericola sp. AK164]
MPGARDLTVELGGTTALSGVSVDLPAGQVTAVVGGDGAGKTTLLRALLGRVATSGGTVDVPPPERIGYEPSTSGVWPTLSVSENVEFVGSAYGLSGDRLRSRAATLLATAGIDDVPDRLGRDLSGGMRQKLGFCLAMLHSPDLLLLDEPSTGVDPVSRVELWRLVTAAARDGASVLMTTTYLDEAERAATVVALQEGRVLASGGPDDVVGTVPGTVSVGDAPPGGRRAWRRGRSFHSWTPDGEEPPGRPVVPDLEDTLIALTLARSEEPR